ncbi:MAG: YraN family protein [Actinobacteria bacterium]|nr:YraN family protein [Actinomycetota bacterium]
MTVWREGEEMACRYLQRRGFRILDRNFRMRTGEIDIIARKGDLIIFCEVKAREGELFGKPFEAVTERKIQRIRRLAESYIAFKKPDFEDARFDVISIENSKIEHIENAF